MKHTSLKKAGSIVWSLVLSAPLLSSTAFAQDGEGEQVYELSPFEVSTSGDRGYYASNSITGSRISVLLQDLPLTIEVVTSEFIEDTGATNMRDALRYSAGIILQSQNDAFTVPTGGFGNVNNPEGATAAMTDSSFKIRGFVTTNTLRKGFRRQHATDTINIDRIEVVRGPSALLYGVGNFGGVVNYLPKAPQLKQAGSVSLSYGSDNLRRATIDSTGPLPFNFAYRLTMAYEDRKHHTELNERDHWFISPVLEFRPFKNTKLTVDFEAGKSNQSGIGFLSVRAPTLEGIPIFQTDRLETYGFLEFEGKDPRTFRWSGPDTYLKTESTNINVEWQQEITEDLNFLIGYNRSDVTFDWRDVFGGIATNSTNARAQPFLDTIRARQIIDGQSNDVFVDVDNAVLQYNWSGAIDDIEWDQFRAELNYQRRFFEGHSWLSSQHSIVLGYSYESQKTETTEFRTADAPGGNNWMFHNPTDSTYLRFGAQSDGVPDYNYRAYALGGGVAENEGVYMIYSARFLRERLFLIGGLRQDTTTSKDGYYGIIGSRAGITEFEDSKLTKTTSQFGASYELRNGFNIYALRSEGVEPNFGGERDGLGRAIESSVATAKEIGFKFNVLDGRIAASISVFRIKREGLPFSYWWAPAPVRGNFDRNADIIYRMDQVNPDRQVSNQILQQALDEWNAAKASGAVYNQLSEDGRSTYTYLNASTEEGAAYLDKVFALLNADAALPRSERSESAWVGFLYEGRDDPHVNNATQDLAEGLYYQAITDESRGWEAQLIFTPTDQLQIVLNYSNVNREVLDPGRFVTYPYAEDNWDRWAVWYYPDQNWGLGGVQPDVAYPGGEPGMPNMDTASWAGVGWGKGESLDDTPKHVVSWWARYRFEHDWLEGFTVGFGGQWESKREYASAFTTSGQKKQNDSESGEVIKAFTDPRLTLNGMLKYEWMMGTRVDAFAQLNVDNFLNDRSQYGLIYAPGRSWRLSVGLSF